MIKWDTQALEGGMVQIKAVYTRNDEPIFDVCCSCASEHEASTRRDMIQAIDIVVSGKKTNEMVAPSEVQMRLEQV